MALKKVCPLKLQIGRHEISAVTWEYPNDGQLTVLSFGNSFTLELNPWQLTQLRDYLDNLGAGDLPD